MANQLILLKKDFFTDEQQAVTVADRYPQDVFAEHTHEFCELVMVWRAMAYTFLMSAHTELPAAICFTFVLKTNTPILPLTIWCCKILFTARSV